MDLAGISGKDIKVLHIFPEPKICELTDLQTKTFATFSLDIHVKSTTPEKVRDLADCRLGKLINDADRDESITLRIEESTLTDEIEVENESLISQAYELELKYDCIRLAFCEVAGLINALSTLKTWANSVRLEKEDGQEFELLQGRVIDYPSIPVRAVSPTFSWYAGFGRIGFDMQLWNLESWKRYIDDCVDNKINQLNMVMYGYWPFEFDEYPETVFRDVPMRQWCGETSRSMELKFTHPNIQNPFLEELIQYAHKLEVKIFAYVGLNSYNGGYTIAHPEKRMKAPRESDFLNDFDSTCLSDPENVDYIVKSMLKIVDLGFDGLCLEESEEGFWFCQCDNCQRNYMSEAATPGEAKHVANMRLLARIDEEVHRRNPELVIGIRAFRQPPLEKDPAWLDEVAKQLPKGCVLFWSPALYVPKSEFRKWIAAFGKERIWGRDSESNSITSTMGRLFRIFEDNVLRYEDEANVQTIERDIEQHISSVQENVHGINGFMFEYTGYFLHQWAHGNYGWGSSLPMDSFFESVMRYHFGKKLGSRLLKLMRSILTIHESQLSIYKVPFPFQSNVIVEDDRALIENALKNVPGQISEVDWIKERLASNEQLRKWVAHIEKIRISLERSRVIYQMALVCLDFEKSDDEDARRRYLERLKDLNRQDFRICAKNYFDVFPVDLTGVRSCMIPSHELEREINNRLGISNHDDRPICSGIEALGWLWLGNSGE